MNAPRRLSEAELALEYFYSRTYRAQYVLRIGTVSAVAVACVHLGTLTPATAVAWVGAFLLCEVLIWCWWDAISPHLGTLDPRTARRRQHEMTFFCGLSTSIAAAPFLAGAPSNVAGAMVAVMFCAGVIMVITAQQSMTRSMFLWTSPLPAFALIRNSAQLATGLDALILGGLGCCFVANALRLQLSNAAGEARLVHGMVFAERSNDVKREFLATVSHEIRTPLNGVIGMAQAMARDDLSPAQAERLGVIQRSGLALQGLLNDVLDLSKIEAGKFELAHERFDLAQLVQSAVDPFLALAQDKGVGLAVTIASDGVVTGDAPRVRQVLTNLVSNAVKFTERGEVRIHAFAHGGGLRIEVQDSGSGIPRAALGRIFEPFAQVKDAGGEPQVGTGLGLTISRDLARLMGGDLDVESTLGEGSRFGLWLPLAVQARTGPRPASPPPSPAPLAPTLDGLRVLIAEDNPTNQLVLRHLLGAVGEFAVETVADGAAAVQAAESQAWDLILMDINMPRMDGVEATQEIRRREGARGVRPTPILALTANAMAHQAPSYFAAGMNGLVPKPVIAAELLAAIIDALQWADQQATPTAKAS